MHISAEYNIICISTYSRTETVDPTALIKSTKDFFEPIWDSVQKAYPGPAGRASPEDVSLEGHASICILREIQNKARENCLK